MITESKDLYRAHLPEGLPLYFQPEYLDAVAEEWTAIVSTDKEAVQWMFPCVKRTKFKVDFYAPSELAHDNGIIKVAETENFKDLVPELGILSNIVINDRHGISPSGLLEGIGRKMRNRQYYELKTYPRDLMEIRKSLRKQLNKSKNCKVEETEDIDRFYKLYQSSFNRRNIDAWSLDRIGFIYDRLKKHYDTRIFILSDDKGRDLTTNWWVGYEKTIYGILRAKNYEINLRGSQEFLVWDIIQQMRQKYHYWDLGGSDIAGVKGFNIKMGAINVQYPSYQLRKPAWIWKLIDLVKRR